MSPGSGQGIQRVQTASIGALEGHRWPKWLLLPLRVALGSALYV